MFAHWYHAISRLHTGAVQSRDYINSIGVQFPDSENVQCNLEIGQIPRLRGTYRSRSKHLDGCRMNATFSGPTHKLSSGGLLMCEICCSRRESMRMHIYNT